MDTQARLIPKWLPVWTLAICSSAVLLYIMPTLESLLIFDRAAIAHGELWRLATGNLVHLSPSHLGYDLGAFLIAGTLIEIRAYRFFPLLCLSAALLIGIAIFWFEPEIYFFGGLSGIVTAAVTYLCLHGLFEKGVWRWLCTAMLAGLTAKIGIELLPGQAFLLVTHSEKFVPIPLSHLVGSIAAIILFVPMRFEITCAQRTLQNGINQSDAIP